MHVTQVATEVIYNSPSGRFQFGGTIYVAGARKVSEPNGLMDQVDPSPWSSALKSTKADLLPLTTDTVRAMLSTVRFQTLMAAASPSTSGWAWSSRAFSAHRR
jgi:hypothetical protein